MMSDALSNSHDSGSKSQMLEEAQGPGAARWKEASTWNKTGAHVFGVGGGTGLRKKLLSCLSSRRALLGCLSASLNSEIEHMA